VRPDVEVSDIGMPDEDGYSLIRRVRSLDAELRHVPAVALSALASEEHRAQALSAGFDLHLAKPGRSGAHPSGRRAVGAPGDGA
jgi:CheY-like chemotaxis protein